ncbi:hypothetical protein ABZ747_33510 [Kitasatospora cineracea]|uniref:hypothetical protein n=1 Tax=Kitasatospora cineracea TaxID=88074 RepID=UPI00340C9260
MRCSPDATVRTLDATDDDIHLFTDPSTETDAAARLTAADLPHLFFTHPATRRGRVLHHRLDGHLARLTG